MSTVLIVEDEMNLAMMMEDILVEAGHRIFKASRLPRALVLAAAESIDVAFLDINLAGEEVFPLALALRSRGVPFVFTSGYGANGIPAIFGDCRTLQKPYQPQQLLDVISALL
jgi:DNA-binding response OmpR family regulator